MFTVARMSSVHLRNEQTITLKVRPNTYIWFQIDNGTDCNVLLLHIYQAVTGDVRLEYVVPSKTRLFIYGQKEVKSSGCVVLDLQ